MELHPRPAPTESKVVKVITALALSDTFSQSAYVRWRTLQYTDCCNLASERVYHTIPASGTGSEGINYDETQYGYDVRKRRNRTVTPGGTITRTVIDPRSLVTSTWLGTDDNGGTATDPSGGGAPGNTMKLVTAGVYDHGADGGDGDLTDRTQYAAASDTRATMYCHDFRGRRVAANGELDVFQCDTYDNLDRVIQTERYDTLGPCCPGSSSSSSSSSSGSAEGNLVSRTETKYDPRGRVCQTIRYGVDPATGTVGNPLTDNIWYDAAGNVLCQLPAGSFQFTKTQYDSLGRVVKQFVGYNPAADLADPLGSGAPDSVTSDVILEQTETTYDHAENVIQITKRERYHNAPASQLGELQNPTTTPKARVTYTAQYHDPLGRVVAVANYGTNGGTALSRPSTIPNRSNNVLVTSSIYDDTGLVRETTDPAGMVVRFEYDDAGRRITMIENYMEVTSSSSSSSSSSSCSSGACGPCDPSDDTNRTTRFTYTPDGQQATLVAENSRTGNQTTTYTYGTTLADSDVATSTLLRAIAYPDSTGPSDRVLFTYNRRGQRRTTTD